MIYMDFKQLEEAQNILKYFYGINTSSCTIDDDVSFSDSLVNIFNQTMKRCCCYSPFPNNPTAFGVFGESPNTSAYSDNFILLHTLFTNCIIYALQAIKHLAYEKEEETICTKIHNDSSLLHNGTYPFMPKHEAQLCTGHFSKYNSTSPAKFYDMDSVQWDSNRKNLRNKVQSNSFYKNIFAIYNLNFPNGKTAFIDAANSDFISHLLLNKELRNLIILLDKYSQKESLSTSDCKTLNNKIVNNNLNSPAVFLDALAKKAAFPIKIDFVDAVIFSRQLESVFHIELYTNLLGNTLRNNFNFHLNHLEQYCQSTYTLFDYNKAYTSFATICLNALNLPHNTIPMPLILYALKQLDKFGNEQYLPSYPNGLFHSGILASEVPVPPSIPLETSYNEWLLRLNRYITILGKIFFPLLEKTFLIILLHTYNNLTYCEIMDLLYEQIKTNSNSFRIDYLNIKPTPKSSDLIKNTVFTKFVFPKNYAECINQFTSIYKTDINNYLETNVPITTHYVHHLYATTNPSTPSDLLIHNLANDFSTADYHPSAHVLPLYRNLSAQIVNHLIK